MSTIYCDKIYGDIDACVTNWSSMSEEERTKQRRFYAAVAAMQSILRIQPVSAKNIVAQYAAMYADALLAELDRTCFDKKS